LEGTGADGSGFGLLETLHGQHHRISLGHMRDEQGINGLQSNHDRMIVRRFDGVDAVEILGMGVAVFRHGGPFQVPFGHRCIKCFPVVKCHPFSQIEGVDPAVGRYLPTVGQAGKKTTAAVHLHQPLKNIGIYHPVDGRSRVGRGVQPRGFRRLANRQGAARGR
jgi:hypothetical protein